MLKANVFMTKCRGFICSIAKIPVQRELWNAIFKPKVEIYIYGVLLLLNKKYLILS